MLQQYLSPAVATREASLNQDSNNLKEVIKFFSFNSNQVVKLKTIILLYRLFFLIGQPEISTATVKLHSKMMA